VTRKDAHQDFNARLEQLRRTYAAAGENPGCHACKACELCAACMFCQECRSCYRCTHCVGCAECSQCSHCRECTQCHACADCTYCFGCVGLQKKDFHILNEPYTRAEYFEKVRELNREL
jgi:hypothetical protein